MKIDKSNSLIETDFSIETPTSVAIYVHWSKNDEISNHDLHVIDSLSNEFQTVIVVRNSNTNTFSKLEMSPDLKENVYFVTRPNEGYDFGGYQFGMNLLMHHSYNITELLLMNNSVFLIKESLSDLMTRVRSTQSDITGLTDSNEGRPHIQSYFLFFGARAIQNSVIWEWFESLKTISDKEATVNSLEIPMMEELSHLGFKTSSVWSFSMLNEFMFSSLAANILGNFRRESGTTYRLRSMENGEFHNPTHYMWAYLIELGFPFIKKDLLRSIPLSNLGHSKWPRYVKSETLQDLIYDEIKTSSRRG